MKKLGLSAVLKFALTGLLLLYLLATDKLDLRSILFLMQRVEVIGPVLLLLLAVTLLAAYRWHLLLHCSPAQVSFGRVLRLTLIGNFFNMALPGGVGGDLVKTYYLVRKDGVAGPAALSTIVVDRFVGTSALIGTGVFALLLAASIQPMENAELQTFWQMLLIAYVAAVPLLWWTLVRSKGRTGTKLLQFLPGNWGERLGSFRDALLEFRHYRATVFVAVITSLIIHACVIAAFTLLGHGLGGSQIPWLHYAVLVPIGLLTMALPIAPAGIGVSHLAFYTLFSLSGFSRGADLFSLYLLCQLLTALPGLVFYLSLTADRHTAYESAGDDPPSMGAEVRVDPGETRRYHTRRGVGESSTHFRE